MLVNALLTHSGENPVQGKDDPQSQNHIFLKKVAHGVLFDKADAPDENGSSLTSDTIITLRSNISSPFFNFGPVRGGITGNPEVIQHAWLVLTGKVGISTWHPSDHLTCAQKVFLFKCSLYQGGGFRIPRERINSGPAICTSGDATPRAASSVGYPPVRRLDW